MSHESVADPLIQCLLLILPLLITGVRLSQRFQNLETDLKGIERCRKFTARRLHVADGGMGIDQVILELAVAGRQISELLAYCEGLLEGV